MCTLPNLPNRSEHQLLMKVQKIVSKREKLTSAEIQINLLEFNAMRVKLLLNTLEMKTFLSAIEHLFLIRGNY